MFICSVHLIVVRFNNTMESAIDTDLLDPVDSAINSVDKSPTNISGPVAPTDESFKFKKRPIEHWDNVCMQRWDFNYSRGSTLTMRFDTCNVCSDLESKVVFSDHHTGIRICQLCMNKIFDQTVLTKKDLILCGEARIKRTEEILKERKNHKKMCKKQYKDSVMFDKNIRKELKKQQIELVLRVAALKMEDAQVKTKTE